MKLLLLLSILLTWNLSALNKDYYFSQYNIKEISDKEGFPSSTIYTITQTKDNYLWFGTEAGLVQYNGINYTLFDKSYFKELNASVIVSVAENTNNNTLWIGTTEGYLINFDYKNDKYKLISNDILLKATYIRNIYYDDNNNLLTVARNNVILIYKNNEFTQIQIPEKNIKLSSTAYNKNTKELYFFMNKNYYYTYKNNQFIKSKEFENVITNKFVDSKNIEYLSFDKSTQAFDVTGNKIILPDDISNSGNLYFTEDKDYNIYYFLRYGSYLKRMTYKNNKFEYNDKKDSYKVGMISYLFEDNEGSIWGSLFGFGLIQFTQPPFVFFSKNEGLSDNIATSLLEKDNKIYIGTVSGDIDVLENNTITQYISLSKLLKLSKTFIISVSSSNNDLIVSTIDNVYIIKDDLQIQQLDLNKSKIPLTVSNIIKDSQGNNWITTSESNGKLFVYKKDIDNDNNKTESFESDNIGKHLYGFVEKNDEKWFGFNDSLGISVYKNNKFTPLKFVNNSVSDLFKDDENNIWVISLNKLYCYKNNGELITIDSTNNLPQTEFYRIIQDKNKNFWITSIKGLYFIKKSNLNDLINKKTDKIEYKKYTTDDGLLSHEFAGGILVSAFLASNGKIYATTTKGVVEIDIDNINTNKIIPNIIIEKIIINNQAINKTVKTVLQPNKYEIEFEFKSLTYINQQKIRYKYQLIGYDKELSEETSKSSIRYTNLPYGKYKFKVIGCNASGYWNETGDFFEFEIKPYYYQQLWFYITIPLLFVIFGYLTNLLRIKNLKQRKKELEQLVALRTQELKEASLKDPLTGLRNRRFFSEILNTEVESFTKLKLYAKNNPSRRLTEKDKSVFGLYIFDIDLFKKINDTYGHDAGDRVLKQFAKILQTSIRTDDVVIRWGGEEFLVILKYTNENYLTTFALNIKNKIASFDFIISDEGKRININTSIGYISYPVYENFPEELSFEESIMFADLGLYYSKRNGRNLAVFVKPNITPDFKDRKWKEYLSSLDKSIENNIIKIEVNK